MRFHFAANNIIYCAVCLTAGVLFLVKPEVMWKLEHFFSARNEAPADLYKKAARVTGVVMLLAAAAMLLIDFQRR